MTDNSKNSSRSALITGSGKNIGRAIALQLASQGYRIIVNGSSDRAACDAVAGQITNAGGQAIVAMGNVGVRDEAMAIAAAGIEAYGSVDVLVNNAAVRPDCKFLEVDEEEWERVININYRAAFWLARACLPGMIANGWGRIIHFTGMNAQQGYAGKAHVTVSKHAAWGLTKSLAKEFGRQGITTNIIAPGTIKGEDNDPAHAKQFDTLLKANPTGRLGTPDDIAGMVSLLVSDAGSFVNGQLLQVNGGVVT
ncbi:MAG: SDR family oxidoreductase [Burkholderiaceae bacterium]